jgi:hypothetical protein
MRSDDEDENDYEEDEDDDDVSGALTVCMHGWMLTPRIRTCTLSFEILLDLGSSWCPHHLACSVLQLIHSFGDDQYDGDGDVDVDGDDGDGDGDEDEDEDDDDDGAGDDDDDDEDDDDEDEDDDDDDDGKDDDDEDAAEGSTAAVTDGKLIHP